MNVSSFERLDHSCSYWPLVTRNTPQDLLLFWPSHQAITVWPLSKWLWSLFPAVYSIPPLDRCHCNEIINGIYLRLIAVDPCTFWKQLINSAAGFFDELSTFIWQLLLQVTLQIFYWTSFCVCQSQLGMVRAFFQELLRNNSVSKPFNVQFNDSPYLWQITHDTVFFLIPLFSTPGKTKGKQFILVHATRFWKQLYCSNRCKWCWSVFKHSSLSLSSSLFPSLPFSFAECGAARLFHCRAQRSAGGAAAERCIQEARLPRPGVRLARSHTHIRSSH